MNATINAPVRCGSSEKSASQHEVVDLALTGMTSQELADRYGFIHRPGAIDLVKHEQRIEQINDLLGDLGEQLMFEPHARGQIVFEFPLVRLTFGFQPGLTRLFIDRSAPTTPEYVADFLESCSVERKGMLGKFCGNRFMPIVERGNLVDLPEKIPGVPGSTERILRDSPYIPKEIFDKIARLYKPATELLLDLASRNNTAAVFAHYEPTTAINHSDGEEHHYDANPDDATRAIGLIGEMECLVGTSDSNCIRVKRVPGDEIIMNYLEEGFGVRAPFHDFENLSESRTLSLVIDEPGLNGLRLFNDAGVFSLPQRQGIVKALSGVEGLQRVIDLTSR